MQPLFSAVPLVALAGEHERELPANGSAIECPSTLDGANAARPEGLLGRVRSVPLERPLG